MKRRSKLSQLGYPWGLLGSMSSKRGSSPAVSVMLAEAVTVICPMVSEASSVMKTA